MKTLSRAQFGNLYGSIATQFKREIEDHLSQLHAGVFHIQFEKPHAFKALKIYNTEKEFLRLRGVYLYRDMQEVTVHEEDYSWAMGGKRLNVDYTFSFNKTMVDDMIFTNENRPWVNITFREPRTIDALTVLTRTRDASYRHANYLAVAVSPDGKTFHQVYSVADQLENLVDKIASSFPDPAYGLNRAQLRLAVKMILYVRCEYDAKYERWVLEGQKLDLNTQDIKDKINEKLLPQKIQITNSDGLVKSFAVWTEEEKRAYVEATRKVIDLLYMFTPHVFYSFGTLLGFIREKNFFIPYDHDIDICFVVDGSKYLTFESLAAELIPYLKYRGVTVVNRVATNLYTVAYKKSPYFDLFPVLEDKTGMCSLGTVNRYRVPKEVLYPTIPMDILGVSCPIPRSPFECLRYFYGDTWRTPIDCRNRVSMNAT